MEITFGGKQVTVRQLTVREVAAYMDDIPSAPTTADLLMDSVITEKAVRMATGLSAEDLNGDATPDELWKLWEAVEKANPSFAALQRRLAEAGRAMLERMEAEGKSGGSPVPSPASTGIPA